MAEFHGIFSPFVSAISNDNKGGGWDGQQGGAARVGWGGWGEKW